MPDYDYCQIEYTSNHHVYNEKLRFWAEAIGPDGTYTAGTSPWYVGTWGSPACDMDLDNNRLNDLVHTLIADSWEPLPSKGPRWFIFTFQRVRTPEVVRKVALLQRVQASMKLSSSLTASDWRRQAGKFFGANQYEEAACAYDIALQLDPEHALSWLHKGHALHNLGRYQEALETFERGLEHKPKEKDLQENARKEQRLLAVRS